MRITFDNDTLRSICEDYELAYEKFGDEKSSILLDRLSDLEAATCVEDIKIGSFEINSKDDKKIFVLYYFTQNKNEFMTFEIPQNKHLLENFKNGYITRLKLIDINL